LISTKKVCIPFGVAISRTLHSFGGFIYSERFREAGKQPPGHPVRGAARSDAPQTRDPSASAAAAP
jgi:hypothetical protein